MKAILCFVFLFTGFLCYSQKTDSFSTDWKNDSLGDNGFRKKCINTEKDTLKNINDIDISGYTKEKIIELLGKPNLTDKKSLTYFISPISMSSQPNGTPQKGHEVIIILFKKGKVVQVLHLLAMPQAN